MKDTELNKCVAMKGKNGKARKENVRNGKQTKKCLRNGWE
jgi:hypothetical protein